MLCMLKSVFMVTSTINLFSDSNQILLSYVYFQILARTLELNSSARLNDLVGRFVNETIKNLGTLLLLG